MSVLVLAGSVRHGRAPLLNLGSGAWVVQDVGGHRSHSVIAVIGRGARGDPLAQPVQAAEALDDKASVWRRSRRSRRSGHRPGSAAGQADPVGPTALPQTPAARGPARRGHAAPRARFTGTRYADPPWRRLTVPQCGVASDAVLDRLEAAFSKRRTELLASDAGRWAAVRAARQPAPPT